MLPVVLMITEALILSMACSVDCAVVGFAYGLNKTKIRFTAAFIVSFICSLALGLSLFFGSIIGKYVKESITLAICAVILIALGLIKIFNSLIKNRFRRRGEIISTNPLSFLGAVMLALALSLDGIAVGLSAGLVREELLFYVIIIGLSIITNAAFLLLGRFLGANAAKRISPNFAWISGLLFIILAIFKLIW